MNKNPIALLDQILIDWLSPRGRRTVHALVALAALVLTAYLAADGDWATAAIALFGTLYAAANKANTPAVATEEDADSDDGETYEEAGGQPFPLS